MWCVGMLVPEEPLPLSSGVAARVACPRQAGAFAHMDETKKNGLMIFDLYFYLMKLFHPYLVFMDETVSSIVLVQVGSSADVFPFVLCSLSL